MTDARLGEVEFKSALAAFEAMMMMQTGRPTTAAEAEVRHKVELMFAGFGAELETYRAAQRESVDTIPYGNLLKKDSSVATWYSGARIAKGEWPDYKRVLETRLPESAIQAIDGSTSRILSRCANPKQPGERRKGLVIGYVQSGKTANYAGLIAKAVDEGYRIVIVLAGMYTNLRAQTQARLEADLNVNDPSEKSGIAWSRLTGHDTDISAQNQVGFMSNSSNVAIMIVKKHEARLANVAKFLESITEETLRNRAVLIIDDESDQATPNTQRDRAYVSTINQRIRDIWKVVKTGTYVAYTATPFANIFIDPSDDDDLYPDDFAMVLPKPDEYMGADKFFDVVQDADVDEDETIYSLARDVSVDDAKVLAPSGRDLSKFEPHVTESLADAIRWFIVATAIRKLRTGKSEHSSMLLHTSHRVAAHGLVKDAVQEFAQNLALRRTAEEASFRALFESEIDRAAGLRDGEAVPAWDEIWRESSTLISRLTIKIDNGQSADRLGYPDDEPQFVVAIGGGTLSRGLTLEGLVVSYFLRTSNTYDTLLQMGRWFGFRPHYRDLVRVWAGPGLIQDYGHLAQVEAQIRSEVAQLENEFKSPRELAIRVRSHPGRLQITSPGKMSSAVLVHAGLGGTRRQTIYLDRSADGTSGGQSAARRLVARAIERAGAPLPRTVGGSLLLRGLSNSDVVEFLGRYWVASADPWLQATAMEKWLGQHGEGAEWHLVLASGPRTRDTFSYDEGIDVNVVSRAPLLEDHWTAKNLPEPAPDEADVVNIRALMSGSDSVLDLRILAENGLLDDPEDLLGRVDRNDFEKIRAVRRAIASHIGVLIVYAVDKMSEPQHGSETRRAMDGADHLIGLAVIYPNAELEDSGEFYAVEVPAALAEEEGDPAQVSDPEGDFHQPEVV